MDGLRTLNYYSDAFKLKVINEVLQGKMTKEQARRKYNLRGKSAILNWMRKFGIEQIETNKQIDLVKKKIKDNNEKELKERIKKLEKELEDANLRAEAYSTMIDIAEKQLKIKIRKKSNTKQ